MGAFRHPNALLPGSETRVDFFATNACNLPKYALEHVWEWFWAFGSGTKNDAKRVPNALLPGSETPVHFFSTTLFRSPKYALEHVWECFWAFGSGTKNDAKRVHFGTQVHYFRVAKLGWIFSQRTDPKIVV